MATKTQTINLAEWLDKVNDGYFANLLSYQPDETITLRPLWSRPRGEQLARDNERMKFAQREPDDPERKEFEERCGLEDMEWCIVEWHMRDDDGNFLDMPSIEVLNILSTHTFNFISWLPLAVFPPKTTPPVKDGDPNLNGSGTHVESTTHPSEPVKVIESIGSTS